MNVIARNEDSLSAAKCERRRRLDSKILRYFQRFFVNWTAKLRNEVNRSDGKQPIEEEA